MSAVGIITRKPSIEALNPLSRGSDLVGVLQNITSLNISEDLIFEEYDYIFDHPSVRLVFYAIYTIVFCLCFFGNLIVMLVVTLHWRMRSITKVCMGNLAFANLCVGVFCVYQNLSTFLAENWIFGRLLCKMYYFTNSLSHTASILILVVICVERYLSILNPFHCRRLLRIQRLRITLAGVWLLSALICSPRLYYITTFEAPFPSRTHGDLEVICAPKRTLYDSRQVDLVYFTLLFVIPLVVMSVLYAKIGAVIWQTSTVLHSPAEPPLTCAVDSCVPPTVPFNSLVTDAPSSSKRSSGNPSEGTFPSKYSLNEEANLTPRCFHSRSNNPRCRLRLPVELHSDLRRNLPAQVSVSVCRVGLTANGKPRSDVGGGMRKGSVLTCFPDCKRLRRALQPTERTPANRIILDAEQSGGRTGGRRLGERHLEEQSLWTTRRLIQVRDERRGRVLQSRQAVIRMLIAIVVTFAVCNFPYHLRKICQYYVPNYNFGSYYNQLITPLSFLLMYTNCAINPILYAFMSKNFRMSLKDLVKFQLRRRNGRRCPGRISM